MNYESRVKEVVNNPGKMSRQQRRNLQRKGQKFEQKQTFTKADLTQSNEAAYEYGKQIALKAAAQVIGLGPTRMNRIEVIIAQLEFDTFVKPFEGGKEE